MVPTRYCEFSKFISTQPFSNTNSLDLADLELFPGHISVSISIAIFQRNSENFSMTYCKIKHFQLLNAYQ